MNGFFFWKSRKPDDYPSFLFGISIHFKYIFNDGFKNYFHFLFYFNEVIVKLVSCLCIYEEGTAERCSNIFTTYSLWRWIFWVRFTVSLFKPFTCNCKVRRNCCDIINLKSRLKLIFIIKCVQQLLFSK